MRRYVVTGGLGTGKSSVIAALGLGFETVAEPARELIAEHRTATGEQTLDARPEVFLDRLISRSLDKYRSVSTSAPTVFDRGLPDCVAYATAFGLDTRAAFDAASPRPYSTPVFVAGPWEEIYTTDDMRQATFAQAEAFHEAVLSAYDLLGYETLELPRAPVHERVAFIRSSIGEAYAASVDRPRSAGRRDG